MGVSTASVQTESGHCSSEVWMRTWDPESNLGPVMLSTLGPCKKGGQESQAVQRLVP